MGGGLKLYCIAAVTQEYRRLQLILKLLAQSDKGKPSVNETTDREVTPESMQFGCSFPRILQAIWEADPVKGPVRVSKLDIMDAYHRVTLRTDHVRAFAYAVPLANLVIPM